MKPSPIVKVLSTLSCREVKHLLMGGQACVLYGGAEFSRDVDVVIPTDADNLERLKKALGDLNAECIAVPPFEADYLRRGHAIHFRCQHPEAMGLRVDVMASMRGVNEYTRLLERSSEIEIEPGTSVPVIGLQDLVKAKKTQRRKDWPIIQRLVEADYMKHYGSPTDEQVDFWLLECLTAQLLIELAKRFPEKTKERVPQRELLSIALTGDEQILEQELLKEEWNEREADRAYWSPLKKELEDLRRQRVEDLRGAPPPS